MTSHLSPSAIVGPLTAMARRVAPLATAHVEHGDDGYWCVSWRINHLADRELFVEYPGLGIAPHVLRVGVYFRDAPEATAAGDNHMTALEALTSRRDALAALGATCTFTAGSATRDDQTFAWDTHDLAQWLTATSAHRDLVSRRDVRTVPPATGQLESLVHGLAPVWHIWNAL